MTWPKHIAGACAALCAWVVALPDAVLILIVMQLADITTGVILAARRGRLCSQIGWKGMTRKVVVWILVAVCYCIQARAHLPAPIGDMAAMYYLAMEGISLAENAAALGVPMPPPLQRWLAAVKRTTEQEDPSSAS